MLFSISFAMSSFCVQWAHVSFHCLHAGTNEQCSYLGYSGDSSSETEELGSLALNEPYSLSYWVYLQSSELFFFCSGKSDPW